jgi:hypothetical protein
MSQPSGNAEDGQADRETRGSLDLSDLTEERKRASRKPARRLHRTLEDHLGTVDLVITDNRRRMVTTRFRQERREIRLHHMFLEPPAPVIDAVVRLSRGEADDGEPRRMLQTYIRANRESIRFRPDDDELKPKGEHFDLDRLLKRARGLLDEPDLDEIAITWGRDGRGSKTIRFGSFDFDQRLIRVHPALDESWVPRFFVEFIIYHELLHAVCPPEGQRNGRRIHTDEFQRLEREFPRYEEAMEWESEHLERFLNRT